MTVEAPIEKPSLDWWDEGHTFYYEWDNGTATQQVNITLTEIVKADDGTIVNGTFQYWGPYNGSNRNFTREVHSRLNRSNMNYPGYYTHIWINETNVVEGEAKIGNETYTLIDDLDTETYLYESPGGDRQFFFDAAKGWLVKAICDDEGMEAILLDTMQDAPPEAGPLTTFCDHNGRSSDDWPDKNQNNREVDHRASTYAEATICFDSSDPFPGGDGDCSMTASGKVSVFRLTWSLFGGQEYRYKFSSNFATDEPASASWFRLTAPDARGIIYLTEDYDPAFDNLNGGTSTGDVAEGAIGDLTAHVWLDIGQSVDDTTATAYLQC